MAEGFDPYSQVFAMIAPDGQSTIPVSMKVLNWYYYNNLTIAVSYSGQISIAGLMILIVLFMTPRAKLARPTTILNLVGLTSCLVGRLLLVLYYTGPFANIYSVFSGDYQYVPRSQYAMSIASTTVGTVLIIVIELALMYQAWTLLRMWSKMPRWIVSIVSVLLVLAVLAFRFASLVYQNISVLTLVLPLHTGWVLQTSVILSSVSIFWFCALFNVRLISHLVQNRGILPSRDKMNPMEILVIVNGILMVIPGIQWSEAGDNFESASWAYTSVVVILPLGTLIAQRVSNGSTTAPPSARGNNSDNSRFFGRKPNLLNSKASTLPDSSVTSQVESGRYKLGKNAVDRELENIDDEFNDRGDGCQVRVYREIDQTEKRI